ncbi:Protein of unknown function [Gryllus bimaculatus]|nr:Protein of unknown function [Gryllus bimaculatus]
MQQAIVVVPEKLQHVATACQGSRSPPAPRLAASRRRTSTTTARSTPPPPRGGGPPPPSTRQERGDRLVEGCDHALAHGLPGRGRGRHQQALQRADDPRRAVERRRVLGEVHDERLEDHKFRLRTKWKYLRDQFAAEFQKNLSARSDDPTQKEGFGPNQHIFHTSIRSLKVKDEFMNQELEETSSKAKLDRINGVFPSEIFLVLVISQPIENVEQTKGSREKDAGGAVDVRHAVDVAAGSGRVGCRPLPLAAVLVVAHQAVQQLAALGHVSLGLRVARDTRAGVGGRRRARQAIDPFVCENEFDTPGIMLYVYYNEILQKKQMFQKASEHLRRNRLRIILINLSRREESNVLLITSEGALVKKNTGSSLLIYPEKEKRKKKNENMSTPPGGEARRLTPHLPRVYFPLGVETHHVKF